MSAQTERLDDVMSLDYRDDAMINDRSSSFSSWRQDVEGSSVVGAIERDQEREFPLRNQAPVL